MTKTPNPPDDELIDAALEGSEEAFAGLVCRYQDRLFRLLTRFCRDHGEVEDLAQEVFTKVYRKLHTFQRDSAFFTWLYRIGVNTANDLLDSRRRRRLHLVDDVEDAVGDGGVDDEAAEGAARPLLEAEMREVTRTILASLPDKFRTVLVLREYEDLSYTEMADVLQISIGTVESRLFRARQKFKDALARRFPDLMPRPVTRGGKR